MTDPTPTTPTPPQGLTDAQLDALERQHWKVESNIEYEPGAGFAEALDKHETFQHRAFARAAIAADRAARHELPPNYVGFEHTGKDRKLLEAFYLAYLAEGGTTDEITLRGIRAAIAAIGAHTGFHCYLDDDGSCPSSCVFDDPAEQISDCTYAQGLQRDGKPKTACPHYRAATVEAAPAPAPTPEEVAARFRSWWGECYPNVPAGPHAVRSHVAFALHLLGGEVQ